MLQLRGIARQTDDLFFPRRDAQGLHNMTVQEIEDVRARSEKPDLDLRIITRGGSPNQNGFRINTDFQIVNISEVTANFAAVTLGLAQPNSIFSYGTWRPQPTDVSGWQVMRSVIASGSAQWSPITPGFRVSPDQANVHVPSLRVPEGSWRTIGFARLDHDGGMRLYRIDFGPHAGLNLRLEPLEHDSDATLSDFAYVPDMFRPPN